MSPGRAVLYVLVMIGLMPAVASAAPCDAAKRELAYGQAATEDAKDRQGFLRAAREFEKAAKKAPNCSAAYFNLGVVYEKAGKLAKAKSAYQRYLKLDPKAPDVSRVEQQVFKLEYRIGRAKARTNLAGIWRSGKDPNEQVKCSMQHFRLSQSGSGYTGRPYMPCRKWRSGYQSISLRVEGLTVTGTIVQNLSQWDNPPRPALLRRSIKGTLSPDGRKMTLRVNVMMANGAVGRRANGWITFDETMTLFRAK